MCHLFSRKMCIRDRLWNNLPGTVQTSFSASEYAGWKIEEIVLWEYPVVPMPVSYTHLITSNVLIPRFEIGTR